MNNNMLIKLDRLRAEKRNLFVALEDFKNGYKAAFTSKVRKAIKNQFELVNARLIEFDRVLSILGIEV